MGKTFKHSSFEKKFREKRPRPIKGKKEKKELEKELNEWNDNDLE